MKVTFIEEIEARKAWRECMACPQCNELKYNIHHQLEPYNAQGWWVECPNCGFASPEGPTRDVAIARWKQC